VGAELFGFELRELERRRHATVAANLRLKSCIVSSVTILE
jgi:hypothetical protein